MRCRSPTTCWTAPAGCAGWRVPLPRSVGAWLASDAPARPEPEDLEEPTVRDQVDPDDEFVPPTPPPIPRPPVDRLLAWTGVFGVPILVLLCIVAGISVPAWFGLLLATGFIGGFGYLVLRMSDEPRDPWDDGAVL